MRAAWLAGPALFVAGLALLMLAVLRGEATLSLVLVVPVVSATGLLGGAGIFLMVLAFLLTFLLWPFRAVVMESAGPALDPMPSTPPSPGGAASGGRRWGGIVFLGPIPVVFGSDVRVTRAMLVVAVVLFLALVVLTVLSLLAI